LLAGDLGDDPVNGDVHRLVCKRRHRLLLAGVSGWLPPWGVLGEDAVWLLGLEGWERWLLLDSSERGDIICGFRPLALVEPLGLPGP